MDSKDGLTLRAGWRLAGVLAELDYLARSGFTGKVEYVMNGTGLMRKLVELGGARELGCEGIDLGYSARLEKWMAAPEAKLKVFFSGGRIKRMET